MTTFTKAYYETQQWIVDCYYEDLAASGHADRCATAHWSSGCLGSQATEGHVKGHVRSLGYANAAAAVADCHAAGTLRSRFIEALTVNGNDTPAVALSLLRRHG